MYNVIVNFTQSLKATAQQIIELSNQLAERVHTWDQEESAPAGGYTDRAGFVIYDDVELFADAYASEDGGMSLLRARLAWAPKDEADQELFTIITLDFNADLEKTRAIIANSENLTQQTLTSLLNDPDTTPKLIHVSLESSAKDSKGKKIGTRYEFDSKELQEITEADEAHFLSTLSKAYEQLVSNLDS